MGLACDSCLSMFLSDDYALLILEADLEERFRHIEENTKIHKVVMSLRSIYVNSFYKTIIDRLRYKKIIMLEYEKSKEYLSNKKIILLSNGEGFIAKNIIFFLQRDFPDTVLVVLQHGIFVTRAPKISDRAARVALNFFSKALFGIYVYGTGFGFSNAHKYIVYNNEYNNYLQSIGILSKNIVISSYFLKGARVEFSKVKNNKSAVFLLQCLSELNISDKKYELFVYTTIIESLSRTYKKVIIKQHPYCNVKLDNLPENCTIIDVNISELVLTANIMVSIFSTALLEYEHLNIPCVAIFNNKLKVDLRQYEVFRYISNFDVLLKDTRFSYKENKSRDLMDVFFEEGCKNYKEVLKELEA
jgi:hypothetical protein